MTRETPGERRGAAFWLYWAGPPLLLMALIFWLGADRASASETRSFLSLLLRTLAPSVYERLSLADLMLLNRIVRKGGHFCGYALLGILNARGWRGVRGTLSRQAGGAAWAAAVLWAAVDEYHQSFSASRSAALEDVALDGCGAAVGIFFYSLWKQRAARSN